MRLLLALLLASASAFAADHYLFTSFRSNGETGVFFALSEDGHTFTPLNENRPWLKPGEAGMLMRDPWLGQGSDGAWHMLWTRGWARNAGEKSLKLGYAESRDLIHWSEQRSIDVLADEPTARNAWALEAAYDEKSGEWTVFWSTTIPGRFSTTDASGDDAYNHRLYCVATRDWVEGPTAVRHGDDWWIYFDHYTKPQGVGAVRTRDWKSFEEISTTLHFPADHRHGTVVKIDEALASRLLAERH